MAFSYYQFSVHAKGANVHAEGLPISVQYMPTLDGHACEFTLCSTDGNRRRITVNFNANEKKNARLTKIHGSLRFKQLASAFLLEQKVGPETVRVRIPAKAGDALEMGVCLDSVQGDDDRDDNAARFVTFTKPSSAEGLASCLLKATERIRELKAECRVMKARICALEDELGQKKRKCNFD